MSAGEREKSGIPLLEALAAGAAEGATGSFALLPGGAAWIRPSSDSGPGWLDWIVGIEDPPRGDIRWKGEGWEQRGPDEASAERGRIGCVFGAGGLVVNLDMDENVWLPARIHRRPWASEEIERWARHFRCWPLPPERAPSVPEAMRKRLLLARAFAGRPELLALERPMNGLAIADRPLLLEGIARLRAAGCAVAWIDERMDTEVRAALEPLAEVDCRRMD
jgi:ABC-type transporter Mla maintaining outer membrane lipid asymmetry ATPase subunit MlaF